LSISFTYKDRDILHCNVTGVLVHYDQVCVSVKAGLFLGECKLIKLS